LYKNQYNNISARENEYFISSCEYRD